MTSSSFLAGSSGVGVGIGTCFARSHECCILWMDGLSLFPCSFSVLQLSFDGHFRLAVLSKRVSLRTAKRLAEASSSTPTEEDGLGMHRMKRRPNSMPPIKGRRRRSSRACRTDDHRRRTNERRTTTITTTVTTTTVTWSISILTTPTRTPTIDSLPTQSSDGLLLHFADDATMNEPTPPSSARGNTHFMDTPMGAGPNGFGAPPPLPSPTGVFAISPSPNLTNGNMIPHQFPSSPFNMISPFSTHLIQGQTPLPSPNGIGAGTGTSPFTPAAPNPLVGFMLYAPSPHIGHMGPYMNPTPHLTPNIPFLSPQQQQQLYRTMGGLQGLQVPAAPGLFRV